MIRKKKTLIIELTWIVDKIGNQQIKLLCHLLKEIFSTEKNKQSK